MTRRTAVVAVLAALALATPALAACTSGTSAPGQTSAGALAPGTTITWALDQQPRQYNPNTVGGDVPSTAQVLNGVLRGFWRYAPDGTVQRDTDFGTYQKVSDDPLVVKYTIAPRAVWSDGVPIDCDDIALAWLADSGVTGEHGFSSVDVESYREMNRPKCEAGDKVVTISYRRPVADWATAFGPGSAVLMPAHVVERASGMEGTFVDLLDTPTSPDLAPAIRFWNTGWTLTPGQVDKSLLLSSGPYLLDSWTAGTSITLKPNPRWWGAPPAAGTVVVRFVPPAQQVDALAAGQVQVISPTADAATLARLTALGAKVHVAAGYRYDVEHLDFNVRGAFGDRTLREAFARCVPRQQIVDKLVKPLNPAAVVQQSRFVLPFQAAYPTFAAAGQQYPPVDVEGARRLLAGRTPTVRIGWREDPDQLNQGRAATLALIKASCGQAGFTVVDAGTPTFLDRELPAGTFDVAMFSWTGSPAVVGQGDLYTTGAPGNVGGYSDRDVDALFGRLARATDPARQTDLLRQIDGRLWNGLATLPLFAYPALLATSPDLTGAQLNPTSEGLTWNVEQWRRS